MVPISQYLFGAVPISRGALGRKGFKKSKAEFRGTSGAVKIFLLRQIVDDIYFFDNNTDTQWNNTSTTDFYTLFGNSTQS